MPPSQALVPADASWVRDGEHALPQGSLRRIGLWSALVVVVGLGGLTAWAAVARVETAVPAAGTVVSGGKRKTVTLAEGGLLRELLVREGDRVAAGAPLLRLDDVQPRAAKAQAHVQHWSALARSTRLATEAADGRDLHIPPALRDAAAVDEAVAAAVAAETRQFHDRWAALDASVRVHERRIAQNQAQIAALRAQALSSGTRFALVQEELRGVDYLMARGLTTKPRQMELRRAEADLAGQVGQIASRMAEAEQAIAQVEGEILNARESRRADISRERTETAATLAESRQRLLALSDQVQKREVLAPEAGTVTDIRLFTPGSSILPGQPVLDLVPDTAELVIEGTVPPFEVERLRVGQRVSVRLSAYKVHRVPVLAGRLTYVGADRQMNAANQPVFLVRAVLEPDALRHYPGVALSPGMPAEIMIVNGARTVLDFLVSPITDSLGRAMKEE